MITDQRVVLAFSGGVASADAMRALSAQHDVVTLTVDIGQGHELTGVRERALVCGAVRAHVLDARDELAHEHFWPALRSGRLDLAAPGELVAPLIAAKLVELARIENAGTVAHEWSGDDAARVEREVALRAPDLRVLAPVSSARRTAFDDATLWSSARLSGDRDFELTRAAAAAPSDGASVDVTFVDGLPHGLNGIEMSLVELLENLETLAGAHGIGRVALREGWVEAPAAVVLDAACTAISACQPASRALHGTVSIRLLQGTCSVVSYAVGEYPLTSTMEPR